MPLVWDEEKNEHQLRCVNDAQHGPAGHPTTMIVNEGWNALTIVHPPPDAHFDPHRGAPVRCFVCTVCGYVELYSGLIVDPKTWSPGG
jgi:hypothetical protein